MTMEAKRWMIIIPLLFLCLFTFASCGSDGKKAKVKAIIVPKFEVGEVSGDYIGEAQLFYDEYTPGAEEIRLPNSPQSTHFYFNEDNGAGILVTGEGKMAAALSLTSLLNCEDYDCSEAMIVSVGCAGGSEGYCTLGDVVLNTAVCDYDLGHRADSRELADPDGGTTWFHDSTFDGCAHHSFDGELVNDVYDRIRDCPLRTTGEAKRILEENYPGEAWAIREPRVLRGTAVTSDDYWKGEQGHRDAEYIVKTYDCADPYAVTEMEEIAVANTADAFGMLDRVVSIRAVVNLDVFFEGVTPEGLWSDAADYGGEVQADNSETLNIFEPAMHNLFDVGRIVIDHALAGDMS